MGEFEAGTQGAVRFEVQGIVDGEPRIVIEHVTRIHPSCAPDWPTPPDGDGAHRVIIEGRPRIEVTVEATDEGGNRAAGGNATAVGRLVERHRLAASTRRPGSTTRSTSRCARRSASSPEGS